MSKIVFLDVDGTLNWLWSKNYLLQPQKLLIKLELMAIKVIFVQGVQKQKILQRNLCDLDGMIGGNGAYVEDNNHVVMHQGLSKEDVKKYCWLV